jgi:hypothetical protein
VDVDGGGTVESSASVDGFGEIKPRNALHEESTTPVMTLLADPAADRPNSETWKTRPRNSEEADAMEASASLR